MEFKEKQHIVFIQISVSLLNHKIQPNTVFKIHSQCILHKQ